MRQGIVFILRIRPSRKLGGVPLYGVAEFFRIFDCKRNLGKAFRKGHHFGFPNRNAENFFGNFDPSPQNRSIEKLVFLA